MIGDDDYVTMRYDRSREYADIYRERFDKSDGVEKSMWAIASELSEIAAAMHTSPNGETLRDKLDDLIDVIGGVSHQESVLSQLTRVADNTEPE